MYIQYVGFNEVASSRTYNFDVIGAAETREFRVKVEAEMFQPARLKVQDGPSICFERLKRELLGETPDLRAERNLNVLDGDIQKYLERQSPRKLIAGKELQYQ